MEQESLFISLLYPNAESYRRHKDPLNRPRISEQSCDELGLSALFSLKSSRLTDFFTMDEDVIVYRKHTLDELSVKSALAELLRETQPCLEDILELEG